MTTIFAASSISIKKLNARVKERIDKIIESGFDVFLGDADGADSAIQSHLFKAGAKNRTMFCTGEAPRNNIGDWPSCIATVDEKHWMQSVVTQILQHIPLSNLGMLNIQQCWLQLATSSSAAKLWRFGMASKASQD